MNSYITDIQKGIIDDLNKSTKLILNKNKVEKSSDLVKSVSWDFKNGSFILMTNDYYQYVDAGRKRGSFPPINDILQWMKDKNIRPSGRMTMGQLAFVISRSIKINGIKAKNFSDKVVDISTDIISEELAEELSVKIVDNIVDAIEN